MAAQIHELFDPVYDDRPDEGIDDRYEREEELSLDDPSLAQLVHWFETVPWRQVESSPPFHYSSVYDHEFQKWLRETPAPPCTMVVLTPKRARPPKELECPHCGETFSFFIPKMKRKWRLGAQDLIDHLFNKHREKHGLSWE